MAPPGPYKGTDTAGLPAPTSATAQARLSNLSHISWVLPYGSPMLDATLEGVLLAGFPSPERVLGRCSAETSKLRRKGKCR